MDIDEPVKSGPPPQIKLAGLLVGLQGLLALGVVVVDTVRGFATGGPSNAVLGQIGFFLLVGAGVVAVGAGLIRGRQWARTPAIVIQLLLLPVVYSLLGPSGQTLIGVVAAAVVITTFLLLISERARRWSMDGFEVSQPPNVH